MSDIPDNLSIEHLIWQSGITRIVGIDEAGRGPLAGPVVAAAVIFEPYAYIEGVTDSKKLSAARRERYFDLIKEHAIAYGIAGVDNVEIDRINIRQATFKAMRMALGRLKQTPEYMLVDGEELPGGLYQQEGLIKGDSRSFTIAAASILAKVTRDKMLLDFHEEFPQYGFDRHKGYGTKEHRQLILQHGPCKWHRKTFLRKLLGEKN